MERAKRLEDLVRKAEILTESLPYMRKFRGKTIVIKYGGAAMVQEDLKKVFASDIVLLKHIGINPVVVHGGGPQINDMLKRLNIPTNFVQGMRVTDEETVSVVEMALVGKVNKEIVSLINSAGGRAVGLSGKDGGMIQAEKMLVEKTGSAGDKPEMIDVGLVGRVTKVDTSVIKALEDAGFVAVIAPVGVGSNGETYNINADYVAGAIAGALQAEKMVILTDSAGIMDKHKQLISGVTQSEVRQMIADGVISGGMLPKADTCFAALDAGVSKAHIIDGRVKHSVLLEIFTDQGVGTEIRRE